MIQIDLKLFVTLAKYHPRGSGPHNVEKGSTISDLIFDLGIDPDTVKLIFINGKKASADQTLCRGDRVGLFPPVGGG
ncbi:MAG: MoaD/ThiS family protein [Desulfobacter sp.]|nr:MoaD/ThiS family protein [Desulfobacter sp.]WDP88082.1 MAG: MoaD/ThiS family protein [Desulfobacter sp.]